MYYLSRGFNVVATDPAPDAEANLRQYVDAAWTTLSKNGIAPSASRDRLTFEPKMAQALAKADFVQENGPERPDFKTKLFAEIDDATPPDSILASSSSSITMDVIQSACKRPERCVIGHPFNPPHVIPLVEVVGGAKTSPQTIRKDRGIFMRPSAKSRFVYSRRFPVMPPTGCRRRSTRRSSISFSRECSASPTRMPP